VEGYHGYWALDIDATRQSEIYAAGAGQVDLAVADQGGNCDFLLYGNVARCPEGSGGNQVRIKHDAAGFVKSYYLHFTNVFVKTGDWVNEDTLLGTAGDSGLASPGSVHLHFEVRHGSFGVDPVPLKACHGDELKSYPGEFQGKTSWSQVAVRQYTVRSDGTYCAAGIPTTLGGGTTTTVAPSTTTTTVPRTTTTLGGGTTPIAGSASGYQVPNLTIFGGVQAPLGPTPSVTLAADASNSPQTASVGTGAAVFGPARIFSSRAITVTTEGSLGAGGSVTSSVDIRDVNRSGAEVLTASRLRSTCTASAGGMSGSTTVTGGVVLTSEGDPDIGGDETYMTVPTNPAPNTAFEGRIETVGDSFRYVFNEQVTNPNGTLTVYAAHLEMLGPTAVGDVYIGRVNCGFGAAGTATTTLPQSMTCDGLTSTIRGTARDDTINGTMGNDVIVGGSGHDTINGGGGDDVICGNDGVDRLFGQDGNDRIFGGAGSDVLDGGNGNDALFGEPGVDRLLGGPGNDALDGGSDQDNCLGGTETDTAVSCTGVIEVP
jgi:Ca2+-binding RTX toxin-like protein